MKREMVNAVIAEILVAKIRLCVIMLPTMAMTEKSKPIPGLRDALVGAKRAKERLNSTPEPAAMSCPEASVITPKRLPNP